MAVSSMKFETEQGISQGVEQRTGKNGVNAYGVFVGMGFTEEFFLRPEEIGFFPPADTQCVITGRVLQSRFGPKFSVNGFRPIKAGRAE